MSRMAGLRGVGVVLAAATALCACGGRSETVDAGLGAPAASGAPSQEEVPVPEVVYGLDAADLPAGFTPAPVPLAPYPGLESAAGQHVVADAYRLPEGPVATVITGPDDGLEVFVGADPEREQIDLGGGRMASVYHHPTRAGAVSVGLPDAPGSPGLSAVVWSTNATPAQLVPLAAAAQLPREQRPGTLLASGTVDALAGTPPGAVAAYRGADAAADTELSVLTFEGTTLDPVIQHVAFDVAPVTVAGRPGFAFGDAEAQAVGWVPEPGRVVAVFGAPGMSRATVLGLAQKVHRIEGGG